MNEKLELDLVKKYPVMLKRYGGDPQVTCFHWGFETPNSWDDIIEELLSKIDEICKNNIGFQVVAEQIKQKFNGFRFYYDLEINGVDKEIVEELKKKVTIFITEAERKIEKLHKIS